MIEKGTNRKEMKRLRPFETVLPTRVRRASDAILEAYSRKSASGHVFGAHNWQYGRVRILPCAKFMVTVNRDKTLKIWGFPSGKLLASIHTRSLALDAEGKKMLSGGKDGVVRGFDLESRLVPKGNSYPASTKKVACRFGKSGPAIIHTAGTRRYSKTWLACRICRRE